MTWKHMRPRDVPHPQRVGAANGKGGFPSTSVREGVPPRRPPICMLFEDLTEGLPPAAVFGMYPVGLLDKLAPWFGCNRREVLHVCSGALPPGEGIRVDIRTDARPDIVADGRSLPLQDASVAAYMADPPYTAEYAREFYGTDYPRPSHLLAEASRVVRPGGRILFVHYIQPNAPAGCEVLKSFGMSMGFGFPMRAVTIYQKAHGGLWG